LIKKEQIQMEKEVLLIEKILILIYQLLQKESINNFGEKIFKKMKVLLKNFMENFVLTNMTEYNNLLKNLINFQILK